MLKYRYICNGKQKTVENSDETEIIRKDLFCVVCIKCSGSKVLHICEPFIDEKKTNK